MTLELCPQYKVIMVIDLHPKKAGLRAEILARRHALSAEDVQTRSRIITETLCALPMYTGASTISSYYAFGNEVQTADIIRHALALGKRVALPRTQRNARRVTLHLVSDVDRLLRGPYGIPEPEADAPLLHPAEVELFVVPGSVFDAAGNRIGYGAGYYDILLAESTGWRIAPCYAFQVTAQLPVETHDMPMDLLVTESGVMDCRRARKIGDHLRMRNMIFYGHHGAFPQEREQGIRLAIDVDMRLDLQVPGLTDNLATTVNYPAVYRLIQRIQSDREFALFEALAEHIALAILREFTLVAEVTIAARKFNPPIGGLIYAFEVEITRKRIAGN